MFFLVSINIFSVHVKFYFVVFIIYMYSFYIRFALYKNKLTKTKKKVHVEKFLF